MSRTLVDHRLGRVSEIPPNEGRTVWVGEHAVAVFHLRDGGVRAVQASCPHRRGPLADGLVGRRTLVCPLHGRTFDLDTGEAAAGEVGIVSYPARVDEDGTIVLSLPEGEPPACLMDEGAPGTDESTEAPFANRDGASVASR